MDGALVVLIFVLGAIAGSFLNVVIVRYNTGDSIIAGGSRCMACNGRLRWRELVPIISFLVQHGRCRRCAARVSLQYPIVEILAGGLFLLVFFKNLSPALTLHLLVTVSLLIVIAVYDLYHHIIPNRIVYVFNALALASLFWTETPGTAFLAGVAFFAFFSFLWGVSKGKWMGLGDGKLALGIGWLLGAVLGILALLIAFWVGAVVGLFLLALGGSRWGMKSQIPFGPFLVLGTFVALLYGNEIIAAIFG